MESKLLKIKWFFPFVCSLLGFILFSTLIFKWNIHPSHRNKIEPQRIPKFVESKLRVSSTSSINQIPRLAYLVSGSVGDGESIKRMLKAIYHPRNYYILHLDLASTASERLDLRLFVNREKIFCEMGNVHVIVKSNLVTYMGPTMVANTLHAASILLNSGEWDWFINLSASDYPLVTQDDLLHTLSSLPRNLNFIDHTSDMGWKEYHRAKPIIVDPGLYLTKKSDLFWVDEKRKLPSAFRLFTGSAWMMLSRPFIEFCLWGWDNLPRNVLMYYSNFVSSPEGYFHTVICNSQEFRNTTVNHDLHFITWDNPPKQHPHFLTINEFPKMVESNAPFARKFIRDDPVLDKIDSGLLSRSHHGFALGAWNDVKEDTNNSSIQFVGNVSALSPGPGAKRLERLIKSLVSKDGFAKKHCL